MSLDHISTNDVDQEWSRLRAGISDPDELAEQMQLKMISAHDAIQLYLTVKRANGSCGEVNFYCAAKLFNAMEELFHTL
jgi:hypothetical protein